MRCEPGGSGPVTNRTNETCRPKETAKVDSAVTADGRAPLLAEGNRTPMLGLGIWNVPNGPECVNAVRWALEFGYRHIGTAQAHGNEDGRMWNENQE